MLGIHLSELQLQVVYAPSTNNDEPLLASIETITLVTLFIIYVWLHTNVQVMYMESVVA